MSYAERHVARAYGLVGEFVRGKVRGDVRPDMVYSKLTTDSRGTYVCEDKDAWVITIWGNKCLMAVDNNVLTTVIEGKLKLSSRFFGYDRNEASSYGYWKEYWEGQHRYSNRGMGADMADAIIEALKRSE